LLQRTLPRAKYQYHGLPQLIAEGHAFGLDRLAAQARALLEILRATQPLALRLAWTSMIQDFRATNAPDLALVHW
jgi:hypothetical protein